MDAIFTAAFWVALWRDQWPVMTLVTLLFVISFIAGWKLRKDDLEIKDLRATTRALLKRSERGDRVLNETLIFLQNAQEKVESLIQRAA